MTNKVQDKLKSLNLELVAVPTNMTHFFQPLDLTVNASAKKFISNAVNQQLDDGKQLDDIDVDFRLTIYNQAPPRTISSQLQRVWRSFSKVGEDPESLGYLTEVQLFLQKIPVYNVI